MNDLRTHLTSIVVDHTDWPARSIADETHFADEIGLYADDLFDMRADIERQLRIEITEVERDDIATFGDLVQLVERRVGALVVASC